MVGVVMIVGLLLIIRQDDLDDEETQGHARERMPCR